MECENVRHRILATAYAYCKKYDIEPTEEFVTMKLYEEVGEFAQAYLIHKKKSRPEKFVDERVSKDMVAKELADVIGMAVFVADVLDIDVEKALQKKWINR